MTKKDYIKIGKILKDNNEWTEIADKLVQIFKEDNSRFSEVKFKVFIGYEND